MRPEFTLKRTSPLPAKLRLVNPSETQLLIAENRALRQRNRELRKDLRSTLNEVTAKAQRTLELTTKNVESSSLLQRLTRRERLVLALIADGHSSRQIAGRLGITFNTVVTN